MSCASQRIDQAAVLLLSICNARSASTVSLSSRSQSWLSCVGRSLAIRLRCCLIAIVTVSATCPRCSPPLPPSSHARLTGASNCFKIVSALRFISACLWLRVCRAGNPASAATYRPRPLRPANHVLLYHPQHDHLSSDCEWGPVGMERYHQRCIQVFALTSHVLDGMIEKQEAP